MTPKTLLARDPSLLSERELSSLVVDVARLAGWRRFHTFDSRKSNKGFPDWVFVKDSQLLFVELKSESGKLRPEQEEWLEALAHIQAALMCALGSAYWFDDDGNSVEYDGELPSVEVCVWRPSDWDSIVETLTGRPPRPRLEAV